MTIQFVYSIHDGFMSMITDKLTITIYTNRIIFIALISLKNLEAGRRYRYQQFNNN